MYKYNAKEGQGDKQTLKDPIKRKKTNRFLLYTVIKVETTEKEM